MTKPFSTIASLVVPPPMSMLRMRLLLLVRRLRGAGAVGRQHRFHVMAGGGADELAALLRQELGDAFGVLAPQRLAGEDHGAGVDLVGVEPGRLVGVVDDAARAPSSSMRSSLE